MAKAWQKGVDWFKNANFYYKEMIGAQSIVLDRKECWCRETINDYGDIEYGRWFFDRVLAPGEDCTDMGIDFEYETREFYKQSSSKASDGLVLEKSAKDFPGAMPILLDGNSHLQMRSSPETRAVLTRILDGESEFNPFFRTDRR